MKCHYDNNLTKKDFASFTVSMDEHHVAIVRAFFDKNPVVNQMIHGYDSMKDINQEVLAEYAEATKQDLTKTLVDIYNHDSKFNDMKGHFK